MDNENQSENQTAPSAPQNGENKFNPVLLLVIAVVAVLVVGYIYYRSQSGSVQTPAVEQVTGGSSPVTEVESPSEEAMMEDDAAMSDAVTVDIEGRNFTFTPNEINAKVGQTVRVTLTAGDLQHDFVIDELDVASERVTAGNSTTVEFKVEQAGEFEFYCSVGNHRAQGMVGTLVVSE